MTENINGFNFYYNCNQIILNVGLPIGSNHNPRILRISYSYSNRAYIIDTEWPTSENKQSYLQRHKRKIRTATLHMIYSAADNLHNKVTHIIISGFFL